MGRHVPARRRARRAVGDEVGPGVAGKVIRPEAVVQLEELRDPPEHERSIVVDPYRGAGSGHGPLVVGDDLDPLVVVRRIGPEIPEHLKLGERRVEDRATEDEQEVMPAVRCRRREGARRGPVPRPEELRPGVGLGIETMEIVEERALERREVVAQAAKEIGRSSQGRDRGRGSARRDVPRGRQLRPLPLVDDGRHRKERSEHDDNTDISIARHGAPVHRL